MAAEQRLLLQPEHLFRYLHKTVGLCGHVEGYGLHICCRRPVMLHDTRIRRDIRDMGRRIAGVQMINVELSSGERVRRKNEIGSAFADGLRDAIQHVFI